MSDVVAPLPSGAGVAAIAEHRARREADAHHRSEDEPHGGEEQGGSRRERRHPDRAAELAPPPAPDEPVVPAETLFAAALLANDLLSLPPSPEELRLRNGHGWEPPDSPLKLTDRLI